ncbi:hypothetical protein C2G38_2041546 [Gigaspora rosea]|uniref:Uncharacterized protein n=1 Tax=Gigaspora rosea TaxID=44941 RepID=A0A397V080_9GLOM|nr:hypothetical protein C2G38_2041546 [Gigaspora rosea]
MSSSDQTEISIDVPRKEKYNFLHEGKKIDKYVLSPNMKCIATLSKEDKSIAVWSITDEIIVNYDNSINVNDLEHALSTDKFCKLPGFKYENIFEKVVDGVLLGISDCKQVIIKLENSFAKYRIFILQLILFILTAIIDIRTKLRQKLIAQGLEDLEGRTKYVAFLENEDLVVITWCPVYRAYIFSKSNINGK